MIYDFQSHKLHNPVSCENILIVFTGALNFCKDCEITQLQLTRLEKDKGEIPLSQFVHNGQVKSLKGLLQKLPWALAPDLIDFWYALWWLHSKGSDLPPVKH